MFDSGPLVDQLRAGERAQHLVGLLIVLMRPHVGGEGGGQRVEGDPLQTVASAASPVTRWPAEARTSPRPPRTARCLATDPVRHNARRR